MGYGKKLVTHVGDPMSFTQLVHVMNLCHRTAHSLSCLGTSPVGEARWNLFCPQARGTMEVLHLSSSARFDSQQHGPWTRCWFEELFPGMDVMKSTTLGSQTATARKETSTVFDFHLQHINNV